jgi:hypothetical protein
MIQTPHPRLMEVFMPRTFVRAHTGILLALLALGVGCTKDDIPSSPSPPYLFTSMIIGKTTTPVPGTTLHPGQTVTVQCEVDYTLAPVDEATRARLGFGLLSGVLSSKDSVSADTVLVSAPAAPPVLAASAGTIPQTMTFKVPAGSKRIFVVAFIDTLPSTGTVLQIDSQSWPVH